MMATLRSQAQRGHDFSREQLDGAHYLFMLQAAEAEHTYQAIRAGGFDHLTRFFNNVLRTADQRGTPSIEPLEAQAAGKISETLGKLRQIVRRDGIAAPDVVGGQLPEAGDLWRGFLPGLLVSSGDIDIPHHDCIAAARQVAVF